jgi:hypothetical protein
VTWLDIRKERVDGACEMDIGVGALNIKCCTRSRPRVVLRQGYKYKPLMSVIGIEHFHNQTGPMPKSSPLDESSNSSRGAIDPSTSVSTGNLVSCLVSCGGFRS